MYEAWQKAYQADPVSIFGGIVAANCEVDEQTAKEINEIFIEIVVAPSYTEGALEILKSKKNIRILKLDNIAGTRNSSVMNLKKVDGGLLVQDSNRMLLDDLKVVTREKPDAETLGDLLFAWRVAKHIKSNGIVLAKDGQTLGIGPGQVNRIWAVENAIRQSRKDLKGL